MARANSIYHLYRNTQRILSATVKREILYHIRNKNLTGLEYYLMCSGDNDFGEGEILGWRNCPKDSDIVICKKTGMRVCLSPEDVKGMNSTPTSNGYYIIKLVNDVKLKVKFSNLEETDGETIQVWREI